MRFQVNKDAYGQPSFQKSTKDSHSESERPLTKSGKPDMRFKVKKEAYGQSSFQKSTKDSHSESERPLTKIGKPDMRFKVNKQAYGQSSFQKSYSSRSSSSGSISDGSSAWERDASVTTEGPLTKNGKPDMRFKVNKEAYGQSSFQKSTKASHSESERYSVPRKKDGTPDMRYTVNKTPSTVNTALPLGNGATPLSGDGTPNMGFAVNKPARKPASPAQTSHSAVTSSCCEGPLKKDGTPDMRFASNKQSASSMSSLPSYSSACGPIRKTGAPDMTYATNKPYYDGPSSSEYRSGGSFYSTELLASLASPGPLKSDGTPDMRYAANRSLYASPYSYGGSNYSSGSSSIRWHTRYEVCSKQALL